jgi:molybdopterin molybdotransferase
VLEKALSTSDIVLVTGGVSVGDYDLVPKAAKACGVRTIFHKVAQRPGKPLFFGMLNSKPFFGLPGNPSSVLSCFYNYVLPAVNCLSGKPPLPPPLRAALTAPVTKAPGLTHFLKGRYEGARATPLGAQESFRLSSFAEANCLICLPEAEAVFDVGAMVDIYPLPGTA